MWQIANWPLQRQLLAIAAVVSGFTAAAILSAYILTAYNYEREHLALHTEFAAAAVSKLIHTHPDTWIYQLGRLEESMDSIAPALMLDERSVRLQIVDGNGGVLVDMGGKPQAPFITARHTVTDGSAISATVELSESVVQVWLHAIPVGVIGIVLAIAVFVILSVLPVRALLRREAALEVARSESRESESLLQLVSDAMPALIGYVDARQTVRVINKVGEDWLARPRAEIIGRPAQDVLPSKLYGQIGPHVAAVLQGKPVSFEHDAVYPDGTLRRVNGRYIPHIAPDGHVHGYFGLVQDVTTQREIEGQLRQAQKTEAIGQLTAGIAHDFNNLLGIILGNIEIVRDRHLNDPDTLAIVDAAMNASLRGGELTQRLLSFSRKQTLMPRVMMINVLIENTVILLRRTFPASIHIDTALANDLWPCAVDAGQLENAIVNLSINGRDAMRDGGLLKIETANIEIGTDAARGTIDGLPPGPYVTITVTDNGAGMSREIADRVFEPFFTTKAIGKGSGLGLSMVYGFAKQSGGQVDITSEAGTGTSVRLYLPKAQAGQAMNCGPESGDRAAPVGRGEIVLVVEDSKDLRNVAVAHLRSEGYTVLQAGDGPSALALIDERPDIALLFTDIILPDGMNGVELAKQARIRRPRLKILLTCGASHQAFFRSSGLKNIAGLIEKPYRKQNLVNRVRAALDEAMDQRTTA